MNVHSMPDNAIDFCPDCGKQPCVQDTDDYTVTDQFNGFLTKIQDNYLKQCLWQRTRRMTTHFLVRTHQEFKKHIGLEDAMYFNSFNRISDYWSRKKVSGNSDFVAIISRDRFKDIRVSLSLHYQFDANDLHTKSTTDSLYNCTPFFNFFQKSYICCSIPWSYHFSQN